MSLDIGKNFDIDAGFNDIIMGTQNSSASLIRLNRMTNTLSQQLHRFMLIVSAFFIIVVEDVDYLESCLTKKDHEKNRIPCLGGLRKDGDLS